MAAKRPKAGQSSPGDTVRVLSDKFVIPADAVQWLDPSQFPPVGTYGPPIQFGTDYDEDVPEGFELLPDDSEPSPP
jgi:hypothetical protein